MERNEKAVALLERAQELMNDEGRHWIQGDYSRQLGGGEYGYCSMGAIYHVADRDHELGVVQLRATEALAEAIDPKFSTSGRSASGVVINYNDLTAQSWDDVKRVFTQAIKRLKKS